MDTNPTKSLVRSLSRPRFSVKRAAELLGLSYPTVWKLVQNGHLRSVMFGGRRVILAAELQRFVEEGNYVEGSESNKDGSDSSTPFNDPHGLEDGC